MLCKMSLKNYSSQDDALKILKQKLEILSAKNFCPRKILLFSLLCTFVKNQNNRGKSSIYFYFKNELHDEVSRCSFSWIFFFVYIFFLFNSLFVFFLSCINKQSSYKANVRGEKYERHSNIGRNRFLNAREEMEADFYGKRLARWSWKSSKIKALTLILVDAVC